MPQAVNRHRTLWISDVHLGSPACKAEILADFLQRNECDRLYLVGDIFDGWKLRSRFYWTLAETRVIQAIINKSLQGTRVYYLIGNHDEFMRKFVRSQIPLGRVRLANELVHKTADGRRLLVLHGDVFDEVVSGFPWLARLGDVGYDLLMKSNGMTNRVREFAGLPYWSLSAFAKTHVKAAVQYLSGFDDKVLTRCRRGRLKGVVCGHTHHAEIRPLVKGITSYNCGDWVESCTALAEDDRGNIRILSSAEPTAVGAARGRRIVARPQPVQGVDLWPVHTRQRPKVDKPGIRPLRTVRTRTKPVRRAARRAQPVPDR